MYVVVFNRLGFLILFMSVIVGYFAGMPAQRFVDDERSITFIQLGVTVLTILVLDLLYRATHNRLVGWMRFVHPRMGGQMFYIPAWGWIPLIGLAVLVAPCSGIPLRANR